MLDTFFWLGYPGFVVELKFSMFDCCLLAVDAFELNTSGLRGFWSLGVYASVISDLRVFRCSVDPDYRKRKNLQHHPSFEGGGFMNQGSPLLPSFYCDTVIHTAGSPTPQKAIGSLRFNKEGEHLGTGISTTTHLSIVPNTNEIEYTKTLA